MIHTIFQRQLRIRRATRPIHRLQKEIPKAQTLKRLRNRIRLRINQLQFIPAPLHQFRPILGANADPVQSIGSRNRSIRLHRDLKPARMQCLNQRQIQLKQWLSTGTHYKPPSASRPFLGDSFRQQFSRLKPTSAHSIHTKKIRIAKLANRRSPIRLASRPQITPRKTAKHRGAPSLRTFPLQRIKNLLNRVPHPASPSLSPLVPSPYVPVSIGSSIPFSRNPFRRNTHESHSPQGTPVSEGS